MIRLRHIALSRQQLDKIPDAERRLLILLAHAANELHILLRLFHFSARQSSGDTLIQQAENAQALVLGRLLTGKIYECWQLLQSAFFGAALSKMYEPRLDKSASQALLALKRYFGRENAIATIRNKYAFHYAPDQIDAGYRALVDGDPLDIYLAKANVNTYFAFADMIVGRAMLESIDPADHKVAFEALIEQTSKAVADLSEVISSITAICLREHLGGTYANCAVVVEVGDVPDSQQVSIPYFVEVAHDDT